MGGVAAVNVPTDGITTVPAALAQCQIVLSVRPENTKEAATMVVVAGIVPEVDGGRPLEEAIWGLHVGNVLLGGIQKQRAEPQIATYVQQANIKR